QTGRRSCTHAQRPASSHRDTADQMKSPIANAWFLIALGFAAQCVSAADAAPLRADVCIYAGTSAGVVAAIRVAKEGRSVVLIEPGRHLGGMSSGGLGQTDFGNKQVIGGLSHEFYKRVGKFYGQAEGWQFQPRHAEQVFNDWI